MSDEALDALIARGEHFIRIDGDAEAKQMLAALYQLKAIRAATVALLYQYDKMPDGTLGHGITNGHFFALRDALELEPD